MAVASAVAFVLVACAMPGASVEPTSEAIPSPTLAVRATPTPSLPTGTPTMQPTQPSPTPTAAPQAGRWTKAKPMPEALAELQAVKLADGRVLVVGQRLDDDGFRVLATVGLLWDPTTGRWHRTPALDRARTGYLLVALQDGRALLAGGSRAGKSTASAMVFDPATDRWTKVGRMGSPRVEAAAAMLPDGRVLVAGGNSAVDIDLPGGSRIPTISLASYHAPQPSEGGWRPPLADLIPPAKVRALATAELFDPRSGTWSPTGAMRFARSGAIAATLTDGRVLVMGSAYEGMGDPVWPDERALDSAELYDPRTGRFSSASKLPSLKWVPGFQRDWPVNTMIAGTLVALPEGDAALFGRISSQYNTFGITRSFRFRAADTTWSEIGKPWLEVSGELYWPPKQVRDGPDVGGAAVVAGLSDGRVLVAGGGGVQPQGSSPVLRKTFVYDPAGDRLSKGPKLPTPRTTAVGVLLEDGSVLVVGGYAKSPWSDAPPLRTAVRFGPAR